MGHGGCQRGGDGGGHPNQTKDADARPVAKVAHVALGRAEHLESQGVPVVHPGRPGQGDGGVPVVDARFERAGQLHASAVAVEVRQEVEALVDAGLAHGVQRLLEDEAHRATLGEAHAASVVGQPQHVGVRGEGGLEHGPVVGVVVGRGDRLRRHGDRSGVVGQPQETEGSAWWVVHLQPVAMVTVGGATLQEQGDEVTGGHHRHTADTGALQRATLPLLHAHAAQVAALLGAVGRGVEAQAHLHEAAAPVAQGEVLVQPHQAVLHQHQPAVLRRHQLPVLPAPDPHGHAGEAVAQGLAPGRGRQVHLARPGEREGEGEGGVAGGGGGADGVGGEGARRHHRVPLALGARLALVHVDVEEVAVATHPRVGVALGHALASEAAWGTAQV